MGASLVAMESFYQFGKQYDDLNFPKQVLDLAKKVVAPLIDKTTGVISHLIVATTCPDSIAPSVGQELSQYFYPHFKNTHVIDIVQGCAGGVTALLLGSQLAKTNGHTTMVVMTDAAKKACDPGGNNYHIFGNGSFACLIKNDNTPKGLLHYQSRQFPELTGVVKVGLGHDADALLATYPDINEHPRKYLGLIMDNELAISLLKKAKQFYDDFVNDLGMKPDIMILHQVNPKIINYLEAVFKDDAIDFVNVSQEAGNCGTASVGIALKSVEQKLDNKKVFICSFGTGGVVTAGMWQC